MATITDVKLGATHDLGRSVVSLQSIVNAAHSRDRQLESLNRISRLASVPANPYLETINRISRLASGPASPYMESLNRTSRLMSKVIQDRRQLNRLVDTVTFPSASLQLDLRPQFNTFPVYIPARHLGSGPFHDEVFSDFLEEAKHFLDSGHKDYAAVIVGISKDYAAVIVGISLEKHLRQLCLNRGMETERKYKSTTRQLKADTLNANLAKAQIYAINDQKSVTAWLGLRNSAVHSNFDEYSSQQVALMIDGVRDFIARNPE